MTAKSKVGNAMNNGIGKKRERIKIKLKEAADGYVSDPTQLQNMEKLVKELAVLNKAAETEKKRDRFERYAAEEAEDTPAPVYRGSECVLDDFVSVFEPSKGDQKKETVEDKIGEIRKCLRKNKIVIVEGDTGCGKTTKLPRLLMNEYPKIVCTQPRKLAAISVARRVAQEAGCELGTTVGYTVRFDNLSSKATKLTFMTDGILINKVHTWGKDTSKGKAGNEKGSKVAGYDLVVIDEAHERTVNIDLLLGYMNKVLSDDTVKTKMLIMSATLNTERFVEYLKCPLISIRHRVHDIEYFYLKLDCPDYISICVRSVLEIIKREKEGDILVFLTGQDDIRRAYATLTTTLSSSKITILKLFSSMPPEEQDLIFKGKNRKVVLSTNIAETSITIENVKFVVDSGKFKCKSYLPDDDIDFLDIATISKAQARQRAGRAGRTQPGKVYRAYSYETFQDMPDNPTPEICRSKLHSMVLAMKNLGINDVLDFDYIDKPQRSALVKAQHYLFYIRAIDWNGMITKLGRRLAQIPLEPEIALSLFAAKNIGCLNSVATISAFLEFQTPFLELKSDHPHYQQYKAAKRLYQHPKGSFYSFLSIFTAWKQSKFSIGFLKKNFLNVRTMHQILNIKRQIVEMFPSGQDVNLDIEKAFCTGFFIKTAKISERGYKTIFGGVECKLKQTDALYHGNNKYIIFNSIFWNKKEFIEHALAVPEYELCSSINRFVFD